MLDLLPNSQRSKYKKFMVNRMDNLHQALMSERVLTVSRQANESLHITYVTHTQSITAKLTFTISLSF